MNRTESNAKVAKGHRKDSQRRITLRSLRRTLRPLRYELLLVVAVLLLTPSIQARSFPIETIQFRSELINKVLPYSVILPRDYYVSRTTRYPVLFLLHGLAGHHDDWLTRTNV